MPYLPPARISDFPRSNSAEQLALAWHNKVTEQIDFYRQLPRFLDPLDADESATRKVISWTGFPRIFDAWLDVEGGTSGSEQTRRINRAHRSAELLNRFTWVKLRDDGQFYRVTPNPPAGWMLYPEVAGRPSFSEAFSFAERPQDEYLEWFVVRDPVTNKITRIDFTAEAPEYWETLAEGDHDLAKTLYSELLQTDVPKEDLFFQRNILCPELIQTATSFQIVGHTQLFKANQYNRHNKWNTKLGVVHLTQRNNTLFAEINLAARATQRFAIRPDLDTDVDRFALTACGGYGGLNRNSDPTIGQTVNTLALSGFRAMVSNPIGLYIGEIDVSGFRAPDGKQVPPEKILTIHRGEFNDIDGLARVLRFSIHPPTDATYGLDACTFDNHPLTTGGPVARKTTVVIHGIAMPANNQQEIVACAAQACAHPGKIPQYFLATPVNDICPASTDSAWEDSPVALAPETPPMILMPGGPRNNGNRIA